MLAPKGIVTPEGMVTPGMVSQLTCGTAPRQGPRGRTAAPHCAGHPPGLQMPGRESPHLLTAFRNLTGRSFAPNLEVLWGFFYLPQFVTTLHKNEGHCTSLHTVLGVKACSSPGVFFVLQKFQCCLLSRSQTEGFKGAPTSPQSTSSHETHLEALPASEITAGRELADTMRPPKDNQDRQIREYSLALFLAVAPCGFPMGKWDPTLIKLKWK